MVGTTLRCSSCGLPLTGGKLDGRRAPPEVVIPDLVASVDVQPVKVSQTAQGEVVIIEPEPFATVRAAPPSRWTTPVQMERWPIFRSVIQAVSGLILTLFFGLGWLILPFLAMTVALGVAAGLGLCSALNGLLVMRRGRRYTFQGVVMILVVIQLVGLAIQPGLAYVFAAAFFRAKGDVPKMHWILESSGQWPADFRNLPARSIATAGLRRHYGEAFEKAAQPPAAVSLDFAFQQLLDDLAKRGSPEIVVDLQEEVDGTVPPDAKNELLALQLAKAAARGGMTEADLKKLPEPVEDLTQTYSRETQANRGKQLAALLAKRLATSMPEAELKLSTLAEVSPGKHPRLEFRGRVRHSGSFMSQTNELGEFDRFAPDRICIIPVTDWKVRLLDGDAKLLGETEFTTTIPKDATWSETGQYVVTEPKDVPRAMAYELTAWGVAGCFGFDVGPQPTSFPARPGKP
jgi:hypothetical protein